MRPTPYPRYYTGLAVVTLVALFGLILANTPSPAVVEAQGGIEPRFFEWGDQPFVDGLNHYLVRVAPSTSETIGDWLDVRDGNTLVVREIPATNSVQPEHIESILEQETDTATVDVTAAALMGTEGIVAATAIGFDIYAVAGSISNRDLESIPGVLTVTEDPALTAATVDPYFPSQWGLDNDGISTDPWSVAFDADVDAPDAWHRTRGRGVVVAVIDSGVDITHPDLVNNIWHNPGEQCGNGIDDDGNGYVDDCTGWDFASRTASVRDYVGHGTHVAGIIAAEANNGIGIAGLAYEAEIMPLKMGDTTPALSAGIEAIAYATANGAQVINASWAVSDPNAAPFLDAAIAGARDAGVLFVTAAGNEPVNIDVTASYPASSTLDNVLTVGASTAMDTPASWSSYGSTSVDIYAPGEYIISTVPGGYDIYSGTSMATPLVAAAAALVWSATPDATYTEVKASLLDRSDGPNDGLTAFGNLSVSEGRLNADRAVYSSPIFQPPVMYEFGDFNTFAPGVGHHVTITAKTVDPWRADPQTPSMYRAGLYVPYDGRPMAVVGHELTFTGATGPASVVTDVTGRALIGDTFDPEERPALVQDGDVTPLTTTLPAGTYAFVMELVDVTDPMTPIAMGDPSAVFFIVGNDGAIADMPQIPIGGAPYPTTTTSSPPPTTIAVTSTTNSATATSTSVWTPEPTTTTYLPAATTTWPPVPTSTVPPTTGAPVPTTTRPPQTTTTPPTTTPPTATTTTTTTTTTWSPVSTTTTSAPTTTSPPQTTTTTLAPPTTRVPATTTTPPTSTTRVPPSTIDGDQMVIYSVNPYSGSTTGHAMVTITGANLPDHPTVYFGDRTAAVLAVFGGTFIVVDTPTGEDGWVDVRVVDPSTGRDTVLPNGYAYVSDGNGLPPTTWPPQTTTTWPSGTTWPPETTWPPTTQWPPQPTTTWNPVTTIAPVPTTSWPTSTTVYTPDNGFDDWRDSLLTTPEGLTLAPVPGDQAIARISLDIWVGALCEDPICPGWVIES